MEKKPGNVSLASILGSRRPTTEIQGQSPNHLVPSSISRDRTGEKNLFNPEPARPKNSRTVGSETPRYIPRIVVSGGADKPAHSSPYSDKRGSSPGRTWRAALVDRPRPIASDSEKEGLQRGTERAAGPLTSKPSATTSSSSSESSVDRRRIMSRSGSRRGSVHIPVPTTPYASLSRYPSDGNGNYTYAPLGPIPNVGYPPPPPAAPQPLLLACPFFKRNPDKHKHVACTGLGFPTIARLKEHIDREHSPGRADPCIDEAQEAQLRKKDLINKTTHHSWRDIYQIVFPGDINIAASDCFTDFDETYDIPWLLKEEIPCRAREKIELSFGQGQGRIKKQFEGIVQNELAGLMRGTVPNLPDKQEGKPQQQLSRPSTNNPIHHTISKDRTQGEGAYLSSLFVMFRKRL